MILENRKRKDITELRPKQGYRKKQKVTALNCVVTIS